jgi:transmembrane sensor
MKAGLPNHSDEQAFRIAYLIAGYIRKTLTVAEHDELDAWVEESDENMKLFEELTDEQNIEASLARMKEIDTEAALQRTAAKLKFNPPGGGRRKRPAWPYLVAASLLLVALTFLLLRKEEGEKLPSSAIREEATPPGGNRATLTLGNGQVIDLQKAKEGRLALEGGSSIEKQKEGELRYIASGAALEGQHLLQTPRGGQYALTLSDGTRVWLNAQSSLRFPSRFTGATRTVELTGEAYFEVSPNKDQPFQVGLPGGNTITVLGTRFNASAYEDEETERVTLLEGRVRLQTPKTVMELRADQQAALKNGTIELVPYPDLPAATAWQEGKFFFRDAPIQSVMRQLQRWYDIEVVYKTTTSEHFNFSASRTEPLSKLLRLMELTDKIHFNVQNKTIYVLP